MYQKYNKYLSETPAFGWARIVKQVSQTLIAADFGSNTILFLEQSEQTTFPLI